MSNVEQEFDGALPQTNENASLSVDDTVSEPTLLPDQELSRAVWDLRNELYEPGEVNFELLNRFQAVSGSADFGWETAPTLHEAVRNFSDSLVQSWYCPTGGPLLAPTDRGDAIQRLTKLALPNPVRVEAELVNEYRKACDNSDSFDDYSKLHGVIVRLALMASECWRLARKAVETRNVIEADGSKIDVDIDSYVSIESAASPKNGATNSNVFCPNGDGYYIEAFDESGHVPIKDAKGLHDIFRLIQSPDTPVEMHELQFGGPVELLPGEKREEQEIADAETVKRLKAEKTRLRCEIESADNEAERADSQRRLDEVTAEGRKMFDRFGRPRNMNAPWDRPRSAIRKRLNKAYEAMAIGGIQKLAVHLKPTIKAMGDSYIYRPGDNPPEWRFSEKIEK